MSQYSLDIVDGYMRVATTVQSYWPYYYFMEDASENATNVKARPVPEFITKNYVTVLEIPKSNGGQPGELKVVGQTDSLGDNGQLFSTVRFFDTVAYLSIADFGYFPTNNTAVEPYFLVMNLTNPADPKVAGALEDIPGFSSYLHPLNSANTLMLAVGQDVDVNGWFSGLSLTVFDASDPATPLTLQRHVVQPVGDDSYTYSDATWDFDAFRYLSLPNDAGIVIIPLTIQADWNSTTSTTSAGNFDGFVVFDVSKNGITERTRISHVNSEDFWGCYYNAYLPSRSLVIQGDLMTMKGHSVVSTNLDSGNVTWNMTLPKPQDDSSDCVNWMVF